MSDKTGVPAFPVTNYEGTYRGMTLRDYFAAKAMQAMITVASTNEVEWHDFDLLARSAYAQADAMLEARKC